MAKTRSQLYVPANNEKMIINSLKLDEDIIIFDLEDAVPDEKKEYAREYILNFLIDKKTEKKIAIRINSMETPYFYRDINDIYNSDAKIDYVVVPKAEPGIGHIYGVLGIPLIPLIETVRGFKHIDNVISEDGVSMISWAAADFSLSMSGNINGYATNEYIATTVAVAARSAGIEPVDKVYFDLENTDGFKDEALKSRNLGYAGKQVIHPSQITTANEVFSPSREDLEWAEKVINTYNESIKTGKGALRLDGKLIDSVHIRMARNILEQSKDDTL